MQQLNLKPTHKLVKSYYEALGQFHQLNIDHEMAARNPFRTLLAGCGRQSTEEHRLPSAQTRGALQ